MPSTLWGPSCWRWGPPRSPGRGWRGSRDGTGPQLPPLPLSPSSAECAGPVPPSLPAVAPAETSLQEAFQTAGAGAGRAAVAATHWAREVVHPLRALDTGSPCLRATDWAPSQRHHHRSHSPEVGSCHTPAPSLPSLAFLAPRGEILTIVPPSDLPRRDSSHQPTPLRAAVSVANKVTIFLAQPCLVSYLIPLSQMPFWHLLIFQITLDKPPVWAFVFSSHSYNTSRGFVTHLVALSVIESSQLWVTILILQIRKLRLRGHTSSQR